MRRITIAVATALVLGAITIALPKLRSKVQANPVASPAAPPIVSGACNNVKFKFKNNLATDKAIIRIEKISYDVVGVGNKTELVHTSNDCKYPDTCYTTGDNLSNAGGRDLKNIQIWYKYKPTTRVGENWSDLVHTPNINKTISNCADGNTYDLGTIPPE